LVFTYYFAETEVCDLDFTVVEDDVLGLKVIVDNFLLLIIEVLEA
jgi:hypothetical protein